MLKSKEDFQHQVMTKVKYLALIKPILAIKVKTSKKTKKCLPHKIIIHDQNNEQLKNIENHNINNVIQLKHSIAHYYQKKEYVNFVLTNEQKVMSLFFWDRAHEHITSSTTLPNNGCKYKICQVK